MISGVIELQVTFVLGIFKQNNDFLMFKSLLRCPRQDVRWVFCIICREFETFEFQSFCFETNPFLEANKSQKRPRKFFVYISYENLTYKSCLLRKEFYSTNQRLKLVANKRKIAHEILSKLKSRTQDLKIWFNSLIFVSC